MAYTLEALLFLTLFFQSSSKSMWQSNMLKLGDHKHIISSTI